MKKAFSILLALLLCASLSLGAAAEDWQGSDFTFTVPEDVAYTLSRAVMSTDPLWALAGIADPSAMLEEYESMEVIADLYTADGRNVKVMSKESATAKSLWDLADLDEAGKASFLDRLIQSQTEDIQIAKEYIDIAGQPFYRVRIDGSGEEGEAHELIVGTVFNGHTLTFDAYGSSPIPQETVVLLEEAAQSVKITQRLEKPEPEPLNIALYLGIILLLTVVVAAPLIYLPIRNRVEKKRKKQMAQRLSEYHRTHEDESSARALRFANETECTREAVHAFSLYHAYLHKLPSLVLGAVVCVGVVAAAFLFDMTWWLKILAVGVSVYFLYRVLSMVTRVEKVQMAVVSRGTSSTARYSFYEEGFRVGGIQSAALYPYFQIQFIRRSGHYLYLYYSEDNAYLVDQYGFTYGEWEDFLAFLQSKLQK